MKKLAAIFCSILFASTALAQTKAPPPESTSPSSSCTPMKDGQSGKAGEPLGDKLANTKGVICPPPSRDSDMKVPPPDSGAKMPVIKPPENAK
jgi:hypothetical protein